MIKFSGIAMTDEINRKNHKFSVLSLLNAYEQSWKFGTPSNLNHDSTKLGGWNFLTGVYFEPRKTHITNELCVPSDKSEYERMQNDNLAYLHDYYYLQRKDKYAILKNELGEHWSESLKPAYISAIAYDGKDVVLKVFPELRQVMNKGLININELKPILPGVFKRGNFLLFAHRFFRRNCSILNSLNDVFLEKLQAIDHSKYDTQIALDMDLIGLAGSERLELEYQYWWGPKFNNELASIPTGVTRYENEHYDNIFSNMCFTEFGWYIQDNRQTFECEEVIDRENILHDNSKYYGCRFVHSMLNPNTELPNHLDGAIRAYSDVQMLDRLDNDISKSERDTQYTKLWRIDNDISVALWKELITHYYRDNILVGEYFGGKDANYDKIVLEKDNTPQIVPLHKYVPTNISAGDGIRFRFSRSSAKEANANKEYDITVLSNEFMIISGHKERVMESDTISVLKMLERAEVKVRWPRTTKVIHGDMVYNFPTFKCTNRQSALKLQEVLSFLCTMWNDRNDDRLISYSIELPKNDEIIKLSFAGHVSDFALIFAQIQTPFPDYDNVHAWLIHLYEINNQFSVANQHPNISEIVAADGTLKFERKFVPPHYLNLKSDEKGVYTTFNIPHENGRELIDNNISMAPIFIQKFTRCSKCKSDYSLCKCIKLVDDCYEEIVDAKLVGASWTNRHA